MGQHLAGCDIKLPAMENRKCGGSATAGSVEVLVERGEAVGLRVRSPVKSHFTLDISFETKPLTSTGVYPRYSEGDDCGCGSTGEASVDTSGLVFPVAGAGGTSAGGSGSGGSGGTSGAADGDGCDPTSWTGSYDVVFDPIESDCPDLGAFTWELMQGVEMSLECRVGSVQWSADQCTRTSHLSCDNNEGTTSEIALLVSQSGDDASLLKGTGRFESSGVVTCDGDYAVTYTQR